MIHYLKLLICCADGYIYIYIHTHTQQDEFPEDSPLVFVLFPTESYDVSCD
jgi:hypothetical protein